MAIETYRRIDKKSDRERSEEFLDVCIRDLRSDGAIIVFDDGESKTTHPLVREGLRLMNLPLTDDVEGQAGAAEYIARDYLKRKGIDDVYVLVEDLYQSHGSGSKVVKFAEVKQ